MLTLSFLLRSVYAPQIENNELNTIKSLEMETKIEWKMKLSRISQLAEWSFYAKLMNIYNKVYFSNDHLIVKLRAMRWWFVNEIASSGISRWYVWRKIQRLIVFVMYPGQRCISNRFDWNQTQIVNAWLPLGYFLSIRLFFFRFLCHFLTLLRAYTPTHTHTHKHAFIHSNTLLFII